MKVDERTYFEEEQKMDSKWMWIFALVFSTILGVVGICYLIGSKENTLTITLVLSSIALSDILIIYLFKTLKLEIALSKKGFHYYSYALIVSKGNIDWKDISAISIIKSPYNSYGKKYSFKNGKVYTMNSKVGVAIQLLNGKKLFFSIENVDAFRTAYQKLQLPLKLE